MVRLASEFCRREANYGMAAKMERGTAAKLERLEGESNIWPLLAGLRFFFATWVLFDHTYNFGPADRAMPIFTKSGLVADVLFCDLGL